MAVSTNSMVKALDITELIIVFAIFRIIYLYNVSNTVTNC